MSNELFTPEYQVKMQEQHREQPNWASGPAVALPDIYDFLRKYDCDLITDYGCGKGELARVVSVPIYRWQQYDPFVEQFSREPVVMPYLVCVDVLEHIEPDCLDAVLQHIASITDVVALLVVANEPAKANFPDGTNLHLIVEDYAWWHAKLAQYFTIVATRKGSTYCNYECKPIR